jgi:hypothetical protein
MTMVTKQAKKKILPIAVAALAVVAIAAVPAMAKDSKKSQGQKSQSHSSAAAAASATGHVPEVARAPKPGEFDSKPGPAWKTVGGTVKSINGNTYTVEDYEGKEVKLVVGQGTKQMRGQKKVGDTIRAEITRGGFANSMQ